MGISGVDPPYLFPHALGCYMRVIISTRRYLPPESLMRGSFSFRSETHGRDGSMVGQDGTGQDRIIA